MMRLLVTLSLLLALVPVATAQSEGDVDFVVTFHADGAVTYDGPLTLLTPTSETARERYEWELLLTEDYTVGEFRDEGAFDVERVRQIVPRLHIHEDQAPCQDETTRGLCDYPLFEWVAREEVWDVDGPARIYNGTGEPGAFVFRIGLPGPDAVGAASPLRATLSVERDVEAPGFELGPIENLTHRSLYRETRTDELALGDMQVREAGSDEWIRNPTVVFHILQRFPVQGFDPETEYETRTVFTDWAGNQAASDVERFTTPPRPEVPLPTITPLSPLPNATLDPGALVVLQARIESPESPVRMEDVRLFFDLQEVHEGYVIENGVLTYTPDVVDVGPHVVSVEVANVAGGSSHARWTFSVGETPAARNEAPLAPLALVLAGLALAACARRR